MIFPDFTLTVPRRELGPEEVFEEFTKYHSAEIGENALVGSIGAEVLRDWTVTFALPEGAVRLTPPASQAEVAGSVVTSTYVESDGTVVAPLTLLDDMAWLPVRWNDGEPAGIMLGTSTYDTRLDVRAARRIGRAAGDVGSVKLGDIDFAEYVAFRPESIVEVHPDLALGITGLGLLESLQVTIDRSRREVRVRSARPPEFPDADLQFFSARAAEDAELLLTFLEQNKDARLAHEAARLLLEYALEDMASEEEVDQAVRWIYDTMAGDLRTTRMLDLMKEMADAGEAGVVVAAGRLGIDAGRDDRYPNAVHEVHGLLGRTLLDRGDGDDAWRHLLSAAFGLPENGRVNYDLGRFYESQGRHRRAFSRYVQAVIRPESGALAIEAMQRVQPLLALDDAGEREPYSVAMVERMIAGKVRSFGAASPFVKSEETPVVRTVLVEFFTNGHLGNEERGGAIGGALGMEGLIGYFSPAGEGSDEVGLDADGGGGGGVPRTGAESDADGGEPAAVDVVFLEHHLPSPRPDALCTSFGERRAAALGIDEPTVIVIDGRASSAGAGRWRDAEEIYSRARRATLARLGTLGDHEVSLMDVTWEDGVVRGEIEVYGPREDTYAVEVVLVEGRVLYPGTSGVVVHRRVARGSLLADSGPLRYGTFVVPGGEVGEDEATFAFEGAVADVEASMAAHLDALESSGAGSAPRISMRIDPTEIRVVAFLYSEETGEILAADECLPAGLPAGEDAGVEALLPPTEEGR
ncbi:MAG: hypothetical protein AAGG01_10685, partial [Planctomycetota bacterium]